MWNYEKRLEYPVNITNPNPEMAKLIISQFGGPDCGRLYIYRKMWLYFDWTWLFGIAVFGRRCYS